MLIKWLDILYPDQSFHLNELAGDASFRRYYRFSLNNQSLIAMDSPPDVEPLESFIKINQLLRTHDITTVEILAINLTDGFLILKDLGNELLSDHIQGPKVDMLYQNALDLLIKMQEIDNTKISLPHFSKSFMMSQMNLFNQWFVTQFLDISLLEHEQKIIQDGFEWITHQVFMQPYGMMHADFHSRNIMVCKNKHDNLAIIDFQDAMLGPYSYDLVSLLKDCYVEWPQHKRAEWLNYFYHHAHHLHCQTHQDFMFGFEITGIQRHIKILGIFARLAIRDKKLRYIQDMPLAMKYLLSSLQQIEPLASFLNLISLRILPQFKEISCLTPQ